MSTIDVVVGGQFGSESKGRVAAALAVKHGLNHKPVLAVRVAGPNAGHVVRHEGADYAMRQIPVGFVNPEADLYIAPGSEIDLQVLVGEIALLESAGFEITNRLSISPEATLIEGYHKTEEQRSELSEKLGSTAKGIGAARADRIWRRARRVQDVADELQGLSSGLQIQDIPINSLLYGREEFRNWAIVIEGTQGYGLGLHAGYYPQCTSSDCRAIDFLAMAGVSPWAIQEGSYGSEQGLKIHLVVRPNPIRVAGNSGPLDGETSWAELGLAEEHTTVTKKVRRVGEYNANAVRRAVEANGIRRVAIAIAMFDHVVPEVAGMTRWREVLNLPDGAFARVQAAMAKFVDWGPGLDDVLVGSIGTGPDSTIWM